jgi:hypothetical protein
VTGIDKSAGILEFEVRRVLKPGGRLVGLLE